MKSLGRMWGWGWGWALCASFFLVHPAAADQNGVDYPHCSLTNATCDACHYMVTDNPPPAWIAADAPYDALCEVCHNDLLRTTLETHSSATTSDQYGTWSIECRTCHWPHHQKQLRTYGEASYVLTGTASGVTSSPPDDQHQYGFGTLTMTGAGWANDQWNGYILVPNTSQLSYSYRITSTSADTLTVEPAIDLAKVSIGDPFAVYYGKLIKSTLPTPNSGNKTVRFFRKTGANSYADGDTVYDGVCEVCHTRTSHYRNDGSATEQNHENLGGKSGTNCIDCHSHTNGFSHGGAGGTGCEACHGHDLAFEFSPGQYSQGRGTFQSHSTHTEDDADDLKGPHLGCDGCHDTNSFPSFKSGVDGNGDGSFSLAETDVCDPCHSPGGTYDGVSDGVFGAKEIWASGAYVATDDSTLRSGKDRWCASCHDEAPAIIGGVSAPNVTGDEDGTYTYGTGWGYYKTGHGLTDASTYPSSGGLVYGAGKGCSDCHDYAGAHIDGDARTYSAGSDNYQAGYRLKSIDGAEPMYIPRPQNVDNHDPGHYRLCFSCHDSNRYLLKTPNPVTTSFRDDLDIGPWDGGTAPINIHEYHLSFNTLDFDSDWDGSLDSEIACVNCHNVHGSTQLSMIRDGELVGREPGMQMYYDSVLIAPTYQAGSVPGPATTLDNSTGTLFWGPSPGNLCQHCHGGDWVKYYRTPPAPPAAPSLAWTSEADYLADGVHPDSGQGGDYFTFRIEYTDANSQPPRLIQVWVDANDNGTYEASEKHDLHEVDSGDVDVSDGKLFRTILGLDLAGDGTISYRFHASDGKFDATNGAATGNPLDDTANTVALTNNAPVLSWTGEDGYIADGVNPGAAVAGSTFTFRVKYADADNDPPATMQVWVDRDDDGTAAGDEATELVSLEAADSDGDYTDGKLYTKDVPIAAAGDNSLQYRFVASDGTDSATGIPTGSRSLTVTTANAAPLLSWTGENGYIRDGVEPDAGAPGATFTFRVRYLDADNNPPSAVQLLIDKNDDGDYLDSGELLDLTAADSDSDYSDGRVYSGAVVLASAGDGILDYRFQAADGAAQATGDPTESNMVTVLIGAKKVSCPGVGDYDYTSIQAAIDNSFDGDLILVADGTCTETITVNNKDLTIVSVNGAGATTIDGNSAATVVTLANGADTILDGFTITGGNRASGYGSGIVISSSSPVIRNSIVIGNYSQRATAVYASGSGSFVTISGCTVDSNTSSLEGPGIYLASGVSAAIVDTTFSNNSTPNGHGGGLYMTTGANASLTVSGSTFSNNDVSTFGGGLYVAGSAGTVTVSIEDTVFDSGNSAQRGGAMYIADSGATLSLAISDSTVSGNSASLEGGALFVSGADSVVIEGSTIAGNSSTDAGGLKVSSAGSLTVTDTSIRDNTASGSVGGGMVLSGATALFDGCAITGNMAGGRGGGGYVYTASPTFRNCIVSGNKATGFEGGGLVFDGAGVAASIVNSTFSGNKAGTTGGAIGNRNSASITVKNSILYGDGGGVGSSEIFGAVSASYSLIGQYGYGGGNNLNTKPYFIDPQSYESAPTSSGDYHVQLSSPAIDAGTSDGAPGDDFDGDLRPLGAGIDMGADEKVTKANNAPTLAWTGETGFAADGVDPDLGTSGGSYVFRVSYADADDDAPSSVQVWIDRNDDGDFLDGGEKIDLAPVDGGDTVFTDGRLYTATVPLAYSGDGVLQYRFYAADGTTAATGSPTSGKSVVVNTVPTLTWLGSGDYASDGVHPDSGASGTTFDFRARYADADNNGPTTIQIWVDANDDGDYLDAGEKLTMTQLDAGDTVYSDGKDYTKTVSLGYAGDGELTYRFYASDGSAATGTPASTGGTVTVTNSVPVLSWLGNGGYISDGVDPNGGLSGANSFEFRIRYTDGDNQAPSSVQVWIDENDSGSYEPGEKHDMTALVPGDTTFSDGKDYTYTATGLTRVSDDDLGYRFAASDGIAAATGTPATVDRQVGIFAANQAPDLDWTGEAGYTADGVAPDSGVEGDTFTFRVKYTDPENTAPTLIQVWVDLDDDAVEDPAELTALDPADAGDTTYDDGKLYSAAIVISSVTNPTTTYKFKAEDGDASPLAATGNATAEQTVMVTGAITVCPAGPPACDYNSINNAIGAVSSGAFILVKDGTYSEYVNYSGKNIAIVSQNGAGSTILQGGTSVNAWDPGLPVVTFNSGETASAVLDGFTIDNQEERSGTRGIVISGATPTIKNCVIKGNRTPGSAYGAGVYVNNSAPTFENCTIKQNYTINRAGAGMYITGAAGGATLTGCTIGGASAADQNFSENGQGGGIYFSGSTTGLLTLDHTAITYNKSASEGAGLYLSGITRTTVIANSSSISNNTQTGDGYGGGIYASSAPMSISDSTISNNSTGVNRGGGGLYLASTSATITGSTINSNTTGGYGGGGIHIGGTTPSLVLSRSNIRGNSALSGGDGGGIKVASGTATITNCIIAGNRVSDVWNYGGGIQSSGTLYLDFSTVADNYAHYGGGLDIAGGTAKAYNSIVWGNAASGGNIEYRGAVTFHLTETAGDTSFVSRSTASSSTATTGGDYHLQANSNCIDSGDGLIHDDTPGAPAVDLDGNVRPTDIAGKGDGTDDYDKGAYEYVP
ncbi:MAG: choice-of-anchor Q domain-containing protein [Thermodesulfobacteriota bacterium]